MGFTAPDVYSLGRHWRTLIATPFWDSFGPGALLKQGFQPRLPHLGRLSPCQQQVPEGVSYIVQDLISDATLNRNGTLLFTEHVVLTTEEELPAENN